MDQLLLALIASAMQRAPAAIAYSVNELFVLLFQESLYIRKGDFLVEFLLDHVQQNFDELDVLIFFFVFFQEGGLLLDDLVNRRPNDIKFVEIINVVVLMALNLFNDENGIFTEFIKR